MRRGDFIALSAGATLAWSLKAHAQQKPIPVIGFLGSSSLATAARQIAGVRQGLSEAGYVEGQNLTIEFRWAEGVYDRLPALAAELVGRKVDVIVAQGPPAARAARSATSTIPVVFGIGSDPVAEGLVASLARPGGNLTGFTLLNTGLTVKQLDLLSELAPQARLFAVLVNPNNPNPWISAVQEAARAKGVQTQILKAATASEIDVAFATMAQERIDALVIGAEPFLSIQDRQIAALATRQRIPSMGALRGFPEVGGLASYGTSLSDVFRQVGLYVGRILKGAKPADLAVQQPTRFELVINLRTAKALDLTVPPSLLAQAEEVIE